MASYGRIHSPERLAEIREYQGLSHHQRQAYDELEQWGWDHSRMFACVRTLGEWKT